MALKARITSEDYEKLPDLLKAEYGEKEDYYVLLVTPFQGEDGSLLSLEDVGALKKAVAQERRKVKDFEAKAKLYDGLDPEEAKAAIAKVKELEDNPGDPDVQKRMDAIREQIEARSKKEIAKVQAQLDEEARQRKLALARLDKMVVETETMAALAEAKPVKLSAAAKAILPFIHSRVRFTQEGEDRSYEIVDEYGEVKITTTPGQVSKMRIDEFVKELKTTEFDFLFEGSGAAGSGAGGSNNNAGGKKQGRVSEADLFKLSPGELISRARGQGQ